jgi:hypothetical protein
MVEQPPGAARTARGDPKFTASIQSNTRIDHNLVDIWRKYEVIMKTSIPGESSFVVYQETA